MTEREAMEHPDLNLLYALDILLEEGSVIGAARRDQRGRQGRL